MKSEPETTTGANAQSTPGRGSRAGTGQGGKVLAPAAEYKRLLRERRVLLSILEHGTAPLTSASLRSLALQCPSKKCAAELLGISRQSLYYAPKKPVKDQALGLKIERLLDKRPDFGYRRVAKALEINHKRAQRVMQKFGLGDR